MEVRVSHTWLRAGVGLGVFLMVAAMGLAGLSGLDTDAALDSFAVVMIVAIPSRGAANTGPSICGSSRSSAAIGRSLVPAAKSWGPTSTSSLRKR